MKKFLIPKKVVGIALLLFVQLQWGAATVFAHGTIFDLTEVSAVEIHAQFDTGEPMANAQVSIYAPDDGSKPWHVGEADSDGYFAFVPDRTIAGTWDVKVQSAGHGDWVYIDVAEDKVVGLTTTSGGLSIAQIVMMSAAVIWGFIGTALYFRRPNSEKQVHNDQPAMAA